MRVRCGGVVGNTETRAEDVDCSYDGEAVMSQSDERGDQDPDICGKG